MLFVIIISNDILQMAVIKSKEYSPMVWETELNPRSSHTKDSKNGTWCLLA